MSVNKNFYYWSERGLVTTFFLDLYQIKGFSGISEFISLIDFNNKKIKIIKDRIISIDIVIEPSFSNKGFGKPDAVFSINFSDQKLVFILEAKIGTYLNSSKDKSSRGKEGFNSCLNGQLELNYCLAMALEKFKTGDRVLIEPDWILDTPYNRDRNGRLRRLQKSNVLKNIVSKFASEPMKNYYHVIVTNDNENPFLTVNKDNLPELFIKKTINGELKTCNCWNLLRKSQFGWINYKKLLEYIKDNDDKLVFGSYFIDTYKINK